MTEATEKTGFTTEERRYGDERRRQLFWVLLMVLL